MSTQHLDRVLEELEEFEERHEPDGDPWLEAVKAALLVEDAIGVTLSDDDIDPTVLKDTAAIRALVRRKTGA